MDVDAVGNIGLSTQKIEARTPLFVADERPAARTWWYSVLLMDTAMIVAATVVASLFAPESPMSLPYLALYCGLTLGFFTAIRSYRHRLTIAILDDVAICFGVSAVATMMVTSLESLLTANTVIAGNAVRLWCFSAIYLSAGRAGLLLAQRNSRKKGEGMEPTLIVGAGHVGSLVWNRLKEHPELGLAPVGFLDKEPIASAESDGAPLLGASWDLERVVGRHGVKHVVLAFSSAPHSVLLDLVARCEALNLRVSVVPRLFERVPSRVDVTHVGGLPLLQLRPSNPRGTQYAVKYALDRVVAAVAIVVLAPLLALITLAVLVSLGRPVLYRQRRVGRDGHPFEMLKFRTMRPALPSDYTTVELGPDTAPGGVEGTDRRSRVGAFLRKSALDELAQLFNIARGEMSFVGPRPERPEFVEIFDENVYRYDERLRVKGGLTGWAQIHRLRGKTSLANRVEWDNYYIENFSLWLDLKILLLTIPEVFRGGTE
jgi:exopolysaccharide biosynthesis polyprenyl glycosylphosphotransferase